MSNRGRCEKGDARNSGRHGENDSDFKEEKRAVMGIGLLQTLVRNS